LINQSFSIVNAEYFDSITIQSRGVGFIYCLFLSDSESYNSI